MMSKKELEKFDTSLIDYLKEGILELKSEVEIGTLLVELLNQLGKLSDVEKNLAILQINAILWEKGIDFQLDLDEKGNPYFFSPQSIKDLNELKDFLDAA